MIEHRYRIAVWIVIASEALLFAGLFTLYASYRAEHPAMFAAGVRADDAWIGGTNTLILLTSSFTFAAATLRPRPRWLLAATALLGCAFLALKGLEWAHHVEKGETGLFVSLYFLMTGLHALHVVAGLALIAWLLAAPRPMRVRLVALYWHFVDVIWVFLWPLFYLMR
jgi:cytochrome c oxidase subunit 3